MSRSCWTLPRLTWFCLAVVGLASSGLASGPTSALAADNWPEFRGPHGNGYSDAKNLPVEFSDTQNVKWKTPIPGKAWSSPVIWGDQVWMSNATADGKVLSAVCVNKNTGKVEHDVKVFEVAEPQFCHAFNSYASPTPVIEEGRLYLHYGSPGTACLDTKTGKVLWTRQDLPCNHHRAAGSSPISVGKGIFISFDGFDVQYVVFLDKETGKTLWKKDRSTDYGNADGDHKKAYGTPLVLELAGKTQIISPGAIGTIAYDAATGDEIWKIQAGGMNAASRPVYGFGKVILTTGDGGFGMYAARPDGKGNVTDTHIDWKYKKSPSRCSQLLIGEHLYFMSEAGIVSCLEAQTGKNLWQHRLGGNYSSSPIYAEGRMYFFSQDGACPVVAPDDKEFKLVADNNLPEGCMASPVTVGKSLLVRTKTHLYCFEKP